MQASLPLWPVALPPAPPIAEQPCSDDSARRTLPPRVEAAIWRATELGTPVTEVVTTGWEQFDRELPGGGWPCRSVTEVLQAQPSICEWRLLGPALRKLVAAGQTIVVVGPPKRPHLPGLRHAGLDDKHFVWVQADTPSERLWVTEQLVKSNACGALLSWLPQARQEQLRRLQVCAQACEGPVILFRPIAAQHEASAAPLRVTATFGLDWELNVHILKRKGPRHEGVLHLPSIPGGLEAVLTPRLMTPSRLIANRERADVLGSATPRQAARRRVHA
jgi:protein ImuA